MAKRQSRSERKEDSIYAMHAILSFILWLTAIIVSLTVGFSMTHGGALYSSVPYVPAQLTAVAGWVVIVLTILSAILAIIETLARK